MKYCKIFETQVDVASRRFLSLVWIIASLKYILCPGKMGMVEQKKLEWKNNPNAILLSTWFLSLNLNSKYLSFVLAFNKNYLENKIIILLLLFYKNKIFEAHKR